MAFLVYDTTFKLPAPEPDRHIAQPALLTDKAVVAGKYQIAAIPQP